MDYNNRMPVYREKAPVKRKIYHREIKDGKSVYVKGLAPDPYKDVSCESLKLKSRIDTGVFENHEGGPRHLEKAQGSDIMTEEIRKAQNDFENARSESAKKAAKKRYDELFEAELKKREQAAKED